MRFVNATALLCFLVVVAVFASDVLPRMDTMPHGRVVEHLVFEIGSLVILLFSGWCMFRRGAVRGGAQFQLLVSFGLQVLMLAAIAELGPWVPVAESTDPADPGPSTTFIYARVVFVLILLALLAHWSWRVSTVTASAEVEEEPAGDEPKPKARGKRPARRDTPTFGPDDYYEPPAVLMGDPRPSVAPPPVRSDSLHEELIAATPTTRHATAAILRIRKGKITTTKKGKTRPPKFDADIVGSATCVVANRYLVCAHRVLNGGDARLPDDKYYALIAPDNGAQIFHFPVTGFAFEDADLDFAVLEIGPCVNGNKRMIALPLSTREVPDGTSVLAVGYPSSPVFELEVDAEGNYVSGNSVLKSHVNTGIVAACFPDLRGNGLYEFNFGWLPGEIGGPVVRLGVPRALFALMKDFRPIRTPDGGVIPGPYQGSSLKPIENVLRQLGAAFV